MYPFGSVFESVLTHNKRMCLKVALTFVQPRDVKNICHSGFCLPLVLAPGSEMIKTYILKDCSFYRMF